MQSKDAGNLGEVAETLLLDAALENIPYGFCVWSPQFRLLMWNKHYRDFYGFSADAIHRGMTLEEVVHLSLKLGNHPGQSPADFYETYSSELLANRKGARAKSREVVNGGRTIETAHVFSEALGWVVTHEDITDEIVHDGLARTAGDLQ
jgi:PAS domain-containing protein